MAQSSLLILNDFQRLQKCTKSWTFGKSQNLLTYIKKYIRKARVDDAKRMSMDDVFKDFAKAHDMGLQGVRQHYSELNRAIAAGYKDLRVYYQKGRPFMSKQVGGPGTVKTTKK